MDENERTELDLEEILKEFGGTSLSEEPEEIPTEVSEEISPEETPVNLEETRRMDPISLEETQRIEPVDLDQTRRIDTIELEETRRIEPVDLDQTRRIDAIEFEETRRMDPVHAPQSDRDVSGDTIRLDGLGDELANLPRQEADFDDGEDARVWTPGNTIHAEPFSQYWEPEYEQPIGEYIPPQPIVFQPRSRLRELKRKLVAGPEKRFYELSEKGVGKLQAAIFLSLLVVLISAISTVMYAFGMVQEHRIRLMVFGQFMALLVSALLGSYQLIEGFGDLGKKRFTLNTMLAITFLVCCVDGVLCLQQIRVPCCAAFSLQVTMSLWNAYQCRSTEMSQTDTMRKAIRLDGIAACGDYLDGKKGLLRTEGQVEDFMDHYTAVSKPEKQLNTYGFISTCIAFVLGIVASVMNGFSAGVQVTAVSLLAAMPATAFIAHSRPTWLLERRLHKLGTVLCGWQGVEGLSGKVVFPLTYNDLYPADAVRLNGMKFFGGREPNQVVAYATAVISAENNGLTGLFSQLLDIHNGRHYDVYNLTHFENGGICGVVEGETVLLGSMSFLKDMDIEVPDGARISSAIYIAIENELCGLFAMSYEKTQSAMAGLSTLTSYRNLDCVFTSNEFMVTHGFMRSKFGIKPKRFLLLDHELREQLRALQIDEDAPTLMLTTALGLAPIAYGVTGARVLRSTCRMGTVLHMIGGIVGLIIMLLLVLLGALDLLTPANMFLCQLVWVLPDLLITQWTYTI